jgi:hypothetical protein
MDKIKQIQKELDEIKVRNKRVESDKEWETSLPRKIIIMVLTYLCVVVLFFYAKLPNPLINAIVPSLAFMISTLTLGFFKNIYFRKKYL